MRFNFPFLKAAEKKKPEPTPEQREQLNEKLCTAADQNDLEGAKQALADGADINCRGQMEATPLMIAGREGSAEVFAYLMENKADITLTNGFKQSALHIVLREGEKKELALPLIRAGAPLNGQDRHGATPAFYAAQNSNVEALKELGGMCADFAIPDKHGKTPLIQASALWHNEAAETIMAFPGPLDAQDNQGMSALMHVALVGNTALVKKFVEAGAKLHLKDNDGNTALQLAKLDPRSRDAAKVLQEAANAVAVAVHDGTMRAMKTLKRFQFRGGLTA